ncbi:MAG: AarF/UbiB family protein [Myxococcota bacterium]
MGSKRVGFRRFQDAALAAPRLTFAALRRGMLPLGPAAVSTARREGVSELHWKILGDALVRFLRSSGPVLTKIGQVLATRSDLLPETVCLRLEQLYAGQPAMARSELRRLLRSAYGRRMPFRRFEWAAFAVGSVGQVHRASLRDGTRVVVKVLRPGVREAVRRDMNALGVFVDLFFSTLARKRRAVQPVVSGVLGDLAEALKRETDLALEAEAVEAFGQRLARNPRVRVPRCFRESSTGEVLVLEELEGEPLSVLRARGASDPEAARRAASLALREILSQIFEDGLFHADPHGGNLLVLEDGRLGLVDLGLTGELDGTDRRKIARAVRAFLARDADATLRSLLEFGAPPPDFDFGAFKTDLQAVLQKDRRKVLARVTGAQAEEPDTSYRLEDTVDQLLRVAHRHGIALPTSTTLLIKTLVTIEGVARSLDPEINVVVTAIPIVLRSLTPRWMRWRRR